MIYDRLRTRFGAAAARTYGQAQLKALGWIMDKAAEGGIDADLVSSDSYVYSGTESDRYRLAREAQTAQEAGMPAAYLTELDVPFPVAGRPSPRPLKISVGIRPRYAGWAPPWWRLTETGRG